MSSNLTADAALNRIRFAIELWEAGEVTTAENTLAAIIATFKTLDNHIINGEPLPTDWQDRKTFAEIEELLNPVGSF